MFTLNSTKMKKFIFSIVLLSCLTAFTTTKVLAWPTVPGYVDFCFTLTDATWTSQSYVMWVQVVANGIQASSWVKFDKVPSPGTYCPPYHVYVPDIPYPGPIGPYTYKIFVKAERDDGVVTLTGWDYGPPTSISPFTLTANSTINVP